MKNSTAFFVVLAIFLESCGLFRSQCSDRKAHFCSSYEYFYDEDWNNRQKFADTRQYFSNFNLFSQVGTACDSLKYLQIYSKKYGSYMYKIAWADSFYLYHYGSPYIIKPCICDMYDIRRIKIFELERPIWKFYKLNDTTYFSTRFVQDYWDSVLHQPQQMLWKRTYQRCDSLRNCKQTRLKNRPVYTYKLLRKNMPENLFWLITKQHKPIIKRRRHPYFSMDSLIRKFQK